jgi:UDPglucose 6-dehydrogenase
VNRQQRGLVLKTLKERLRVLQGRRVCLLGLAFKPDTDDLRDAPAVEVARQLLANGVMVTAYDPAVARVPELPDLGIARDVHQAADEADAVVLLTEWPEFTALDFVALRARARGNLFFDGRNCLDPDVMARAGFEYTCVGGTRSPVLDLSAAETAGIGCSPVTVLE